MSGLMDYTHYLAKVIGPRPTGTEEEQQAALYITEQLQRESGFTANIEEFQRSTNPDLSYAILGGISAVVALASLFLSVISIPAFIILVFVAAIYVLETLGHPLLSHMLAKGASQNVIAKYQPNVEDDNSRSVTRKLILVAHYDSGHVTPGLVKRMDSFKVSFDVIESVVMVVLAFLGLLRIFVAITGGGLLIILNVITVVAIVIALLPLIRFIMLNNAPYNEGANNNASGTAALIEIARRISQGSVSESDLIEHRDEVTIHGQDAALDAGLVPEGAVLSYEAQETAASDPTMSGLNEEDRLLAAKAAIAALTGKPVENVLYSTPSSSASAPAATQESVATNVLTADTGEEGQPAQIESISEDIDGEQVALGVSETVDAEEMPTDVDLGETNAIDMRTLGMIVEDEDSDQTADASLDQESESAMTQEEQPQEEISISAYFAAANAQAQEAGMQVAYAPLPQKDTSAQTAASISVADKLIADVPATDEVVEEDVAGFQNVPSWFAAAQKNAKRSNNPAEIQRSRYTEAMEHAEHEREERETAQLAEEMAQLEAERLAREAEARAALEAHELEEKAKRDAEESGVVIEEAEVVEEVEAVAETSDDTLLVAEEVIEEPETMQASQAQDVARPLQAAQTQEASQVTPTPAQVLKSKIPAVKDDLLAQALDYKSAQEAQSNAAYAQDTIAMTQEQSAAVNQAAQAVVSRQERLMKLRTNIPSLSGVIRTKDAARRASIESLSNKLSGGDVSSQPTTIITSEDVLGSAASNAPAPVRTSPAARNLHTLAGGRSLSSIPSPAQDAGASYDQEVDYDMELSDFGAGYDSSYGLGFNNQEEYDFASNLYEEDALTEEYDGNYSDDYDYGEYDNAFLDDDDFAAQEKPKRKGLFSRFRHKKEEETLDSPQEWLGVDEDFDARSVGRARGSWESFRQDYDDIDDPFNDDNYDDFGNFDDSVSSRRGRRWQGGSYSRMSLGHVDMRSGIDTEADMTIPDVPPEAEKDRFITGEIERIYHFRNLAFNTEIWFVAMGCDNASHDGVRAFINEHKSELRGSMVIEVESLGAGTLSVAKREGATKKVSASSRIKRHTREAVAATGISLDEVDMSGTESIASIIQKAGFQSMHLFGAEDGRPALKGSADDVFENIDELVFDENTRFVYELLKR